MILLGLTLWGIAACIDTLMSLYRTRNIKTTYNLLQFSEALRETPIFFKIIGYISALIGIAGFALIYTSSGFLGFAFIAMMFASMGVHFFVIYGVAKVLHLWRIK